MKKAMPWVLAMIWLATVGGGMGVLLVYDFTPGKDSEFVPKVWPAGLPRAADRPTLVMFAHPKCPCTRASIGELAVLMARCQGLVNAQVVFFRPQGTSEDWDHTDLWRSAAEIPGVKVQSDEGGREARNFRATASGYTVLYDTRGRLIFSGGITDSRGHAGDNPGRSAIVDLLHHRPTANTRTPTFGCSLLNPTSETF